MCQIVLGNGDTVEKQNSQVGEHTVKPQGAENFKTGQSRALGEALDIEAFSSTSLK
jgi:hypothetical protein